MPTVSRLFLKFGLIYFVAAMLTGVAMAALGGAWSTLLLPTYLHLFVVGWITQIIIGVALWLFPKWTKDQPRGREWLSWVALVTLNVGLLLRAVFEPLYTMGTLSDATTLAAVGFIASALLQWIGGVAFMLNIWVRIKGKQSRPARTKATAKAAAGATKAAFGAPKAGAAAPGVDNEQRKAAAAARKARAAASREDDAEDGAADEEAP